MNLDRSAAWTRRALAAVAPNALDALDAMGDASDGADAALGSEAIEEARSISQTFIGGGALFQGTLTLKESITIDCEFHGSLVCEGTVIVAESGGVTANIEAREIDIRGAVVGNVTAKRLVLVRAGAKLHGDVVTPCFELERHGFFNGTTKMERPEIALREGRIAHPESAPQQEIAPAQPAPVI